MEIIFFDNKIEKFITELREPARTKMSRTIFLLAEFGHEIGSPHSKPLGERLFELRIMDKESVRIFYTFSGGGAVLLHGFVKKTEKTPKRELDIAKRKLNALRHI